MITIRRIKYIGNALVRREIRNAYQFFDRKNFEYIRQPGIPRR
jgi:hypothetical protein